MHALYRDLHPQKTFGLQNASLSYEIASNFKYEHLESLE
jgi:hypothetical protein